MRNRALTALWIHMIVSSGCAHPLPHSQYTLEHVELDIVPSPPKTGQPVLMKISPSPSSQVLAIQACGSAAVPVSNESGILHVLFGVPADMSGASCSIGMNLKNQTGSATETISIPVTRLDEDEEELEVDPGLIDFSAENKTRFEHDRKLLHEIFTTSLIEEGTFRLKSWQIPRKSEISSRFGLRRSYNSGVYRNYHNGVDLRGDYGDSIHAPAPGTVVLVSDLLITGTTVIVAHGAGVFSVFAHLLTSNVTVGQSVDVGQVLGEIGDSGRVTGPHLHWSVVVNGVYVDPMTFLDLMKWH